MGKYPVSFNICQVVINEHKDIFADTIRALRGALLDLGYACGHTQNLFVPGAVNIVLGGTVIMDSVPELAPFLGRQPFVLYQFEQLDPAHGFLRTNPGYDRVIRSATHILEYSHVGLRHLHERSEGVKASFLPPSFHRALELFRPAETQDIDVLFYGNPADRRMDVLRQIGRAGPKVYSLYGVYGANLHNHIRRAKIVINIHGDPAMRVLETVRLSFLLANRCFVVSETGDHNPYGDGVAFADYDRLAETCLDYLQAPERREAVAAEGYLAVRRSDLVSDLRRAIDEMPLEALTRAAN